MATHTAATAASNTMYLIKGHNLRGEPQAFATNKNIRALLAKEGAVVLQIILVKIQ